MNAADGPAARTAAEELEAAATKMANLYDVLAHTSELALTRVPNFEVIRELNRNPVGEIINARDHVLDDDPALDRAMRRVLRSAQAFDGVVDRVVWRVRDHDRARAHGRDVDCLLIRRSLDFDLERIDKRARRVARDAEKLAVVACRRVTRSGRRVSAGSAAPGATRARPSPQAVRVITAAVRLLPQAHRARYREEYRGELHELVGSGCPRRAQLRYACALLIYAAALRRSLAAPQPARERSL